MPGVPVVSPGAHVMPGGLAPDDRSGAAHVLAGVLPYPCPRIAAARLVASFLGNRLGRLAFLDVLSALVGILQVVVVIHGFLI
jgi:hypothetical protein